jgi:trehalose 6-phosphate phosphatase
MTPDLSNMVPVQDIPDFWDTLHSSIRAFLSLDYDGTLAPFSTKRMEAYPYPGIPELLARIRETTGDMVAIISGRPAAEVVRLMGERDFVIVGSHGYELRYPGGTTVRKDPEPQQMKGLNEAKLMLEKQDMSGNLEVKVASLAFHTRGFPVVDAMKIENQVHAMWLNVANDRNLDVRRFNGGVELISKGWNKGDALRELLDLQPAGTYSVYIGDDDTDEDAFQAIKGRGLGILVGPRYKKSGAVTYLKDIKAVKDFLESWLLCVTTRYS